MQRTFSAPELSAWAVLDVHHYFAWGFTGCDAGARAGCVYACDEPAADVSARLESAADAFAGSLRAAAGMHGVPHVACTEWSLATHSDSSVACKGGDVLATMHRAQSLAYERHGVQQFFWGWKMPYGGYHKSGWSLKMFFTGRDDTEETSEPGRGSSPFVSRIPRTTREHDRGRGRRRDDHEAATKGGAGEEIRVQGGGAGDEKGSGRAEKAADEGDVEKFSDDDTSEYDVDEGNANGGGKERRVESVGGDGVADGGGGDGGDGGEDRVGGVVIGGERKKEKKHRKHREEKSPRW